METILVNSSNQNIDINAKNNNGETAFHMAFKHRQSTIIEMLIQNASKYSIGLDVVNNAGQTGYDLILTNGNSNDIVKMLTEKYFHLSAGFQFGDREVKYALIHGNPETAKILIKKAVELKIDMNLNDEWG